MQTLEEINSLIRETGWTVHLARSLHDQSEFLRLYRTDVSGKKIFVTSLPLETTAGVICAFAGACNHYFHLGASFKDAERSLHGQDA